MKIAEYDGLSIVTSELFLKNNIRHLFTTVKDSKKDKLINYSFNSEKKEEILANYKKIAEYFDVALEDLVKSTQIHEDNIVQITNEHKGMGITRDTVFSNADGIFTDKSKIPLCIFSADCVPILIADKNKTAVFAVHAGWRGTGKNITGKAVRLMIKKYGVRACDIICAIGPAIGQCCFEVSGEVIDTLAKVGDVRPYCKEKENGKYQLDLKGFNKRLLEAEGVLAENIDVCGFCTKCEKDLFHSYRRDGVNAGRNAAFIML